jgi:hypothetical protein
MQIKEVTDCTIENLNEYISQVHEPLVLRGLVADWPLVIEAKKSVDAAEQYLRKYLPQDANQAKVTAYLAPAQAQGRIFYNDDMSGFNFERQRTTLANVLDRMKHHNDDKNPPTFYVGSTAVEHCLPGLKAANDLPLEHLSPMNNIWIGNQLSVAAHFDGLNNVACIGAGRRKFTLFPPDQIDNLYIGPLDFTPSGQAISLVDFAQPDFAKYPRFKQALAHAQVAELGPGDAVYIPAMWWHHIKSLGSFNVLINYWWSDVPAYIGSAMDVLNHALLGIRDLPPEQRTAWQQLFDHYVFNPSEKAHEHIPKDKRGVLDTHNETSARRLRSQLLNRLNR